MAPATQHCKVEGCKRAYRSKGYCELHFKKWRRGELSKSPRYKRCTEENCRKPRGRWGVCTDHFQAKYGKKAPAEMATPAAGPAAAGLTADA